MKKYFLKKQNGQVMIVVVLALGAVMIGANIVGGVLINSQIRQSTNIIDSTKAIYAADAAIEAGYYQFLKGNNVSLTFSNRASSTIKCFDGLRNSVSCNATSVSYIVGQGFAGRVTRALELQF
jgi:Tfp pilus assembly protein PilX